MSYLIVILLLGSCACLHAQDDSVRISTITIEAEQSLSVELPSAASLNNIADQLSTEENIYIKSYGLGSSSTISLRGGNANHTQLRWEDIPITNPMLGLADLSLIPTLPFQTMSIQKGGQSTTYGSGAITGLVDWSSEISETDQLIAELGYGSYAQKNLQLAAAQTIGTKLNSSLSTYFRKADNDFIYSKGTAREAQKNADLLTYGTVMNNILTLDPKNKLKANVWLQFMERGIPPTLVQDLSVARQTDKSHRYKLSWINNTAHTQLETYLAYSDEDNDYVDTVNQIDTHNQFQQVIGGVKGMTAPDNWIIKWDANQTHIKGRTEAYDNNSQTQNITALYGEVKYNSGIFNSGLGARQEWRDNRRSPFLPSMRLGLQSGNLATYLKVSKEFRAPTLNERFWVPGGNKELEAEQGWNQELTFTYSDTEKERFVQLAIFHRQINNWILWAPADGSFIWSAYNLAKVRSYGSELELSRSFNIKDWELSTGLNLNYTLSRNQRKIRLPVIEEGAQIFYTPREQLLYNLQLKKKAFSIGSTLQYTGETTGINEDIPGFFLAHLKFSYILGQKHQYILEFYINNISNTEYQVIERRPMPGRNFQINLRTNIKT